MATLFKDQQGRFQIQFTRPDGRRPAIRLGSVTKRQAENVRWFVEDLLASHDTGSSPSAATVEWLASAPDRVRRLLEREGLAEARERQVIPTLADWLQAYRDGRADVKPGTQINYKQVVRNLLDYFGGDRRIDHITAGDADEFHVWLKTHENLAEGTIRRRCKRAKQFFTAARKKKILTENPFEGIRCGDIANAKRFYYVTRKEAQTVLDACPDAQWRLIFALCRFGGIRCPSEVVGLKWEDVDWERMRFTVYAAKTEHHQDGGIRRVPIFPELYPHLRDVFEAAEPGATYVVRRYRYPNQNLRTELGRIIRRAGLQAWPKLFQNLRSTRETELTEQYPLHVVCAWIGNSGSVAAKHYLQVTDAHFAKAAGQTPPVPASEVPSAVPADLARQWASLPDAVRTSILDLASKAVQTPQG